MKVKMRDGYMGSQVCLISSLRMYTRTFLWTYEQ